MKKSKEKKTGFCYITGAGPGDLSLISVKALEVVRTADVIFYDYLANAGILDFAKSGSEKIYVGKKAAEHSFSQEEICNMLCQRVREGKCVLRLKGGDPFIFGRGGEEAIALKEAGLNFEIIPGITAASGAASYASVPLTHRGLATSVTFVTGHESPEKESEQTNWKALAQSGSTLCIYMGLGRIEKICKTLISNGRQKDTPVAVIQSGTLPQQREVYGSLENISAKVKDENISSPAIIIVGEVVGIKDKINISSNKPLSGAMVIVTRPQNQSSSFSKKLERLGAETVELAAVSIEENKFNTSCFDKLKDGYFDWVIFTSRNGVTHTWDKLISLGMDTRIFGNAKVGAIGSATAEALRGIGVIADVVPEKFIAEDLFESVCQFSGALAGKKILMLRSDIARTNLKKLFEDAGSEVTEIAAYRTVVNQNPIPAHALKRILECTKKKFITFTSSSTVEGFCNYLENSNIKIADIPEPVKLVSIGPITTATMKANNLSADIEAEEYSTGGIVSAIIEDCSQG